MKKLVRKVLHKIWNRRGGVVFGLLVISVVSFILFAILSIVAMHTEKLMFTEEPSDGWRTVRNLEPIRDEDGIHSVRLVRHDHVNRIFMHEPDRYTVFLVSSNSTMLSVKTYSSISPTIFADLGDDEQLWIGMKELVGRFGIQNTNVEFHIHSNHVDGDIVGAGWKRMTGKNQFLTGSTAEVR